MVITGLPMVVYAQSSTPEVSLDEFAKQLQELQDEYDDTKYISEITIENGCESYHVDGAENIITDSADDIVEAVVTSDDFEIPLSVIADYCQLPETSTYSLDENTYDDITVDKETAEALGFEVEIEDDKAVLTQPYQTERLIVKSKYDINPLDSVAMIEGYNDLHIVQFDNQESTKQAEEYYNNQKYIEYAEPDSVVSTMDIDYTAEASAVTSPSIHYDNHLSWGSETIGVDDYVDYLGDVSELPEVIVGIIDTGIDLDHEFLKDRIIETGYNVSDSGLKNSEDDDEGHGSHVAGIIVDNTTDNVKIKGFKCLNDGGRGVTSNAALSIDAAVESGVNVINMSLGSKGTNSLMEASVNNAIKQGVTVVVAAGNSGDDASKYCPAYIQECITVAAIDSNSVFPYWTNHGSCVDIGAPGVSIYSTFKNNTYETLNGTSMASPFVAAAAALMLSKNINGSPHSICDTLKSNGYECRGLGSWVKDVKGLYIGTVTEYNRDRTVMPEFSMQSGQYLETITVEITCEDENAEIYYTTDGSRASENTGTLYTEPIVIDKVTRVHAVAYSPNKLKSLQAYADYYIVYTDPDENFEIDSDGLITKYNGNNNYLKIPDTIAGITVTGIGTRVFNRSDMVMIEFPDTLTYVGDHAFYLCKSLNSVNANNIKHIGPSGFCACFKLAQIDLTKAESIGKNGCMSLKSISSLYNDKLTKIEDGAFRSCNHIINIDIPNVTEIGDHGFDAIYDLDSLNAPKVEIIGNSAFYYCSHIETMDFPNLISFGSSAFAITKSLKTINMPKYYGEIPANAFESSGIEYFDNDHITSLGNYAFSNSKLRYIKLDNAQSIGNNTFDRCWDLELIHLPAVTKIGIRAFKDSKNINILFTPSLVSAQSLPENDGATLYLSNKFTSEGNPQFNYTLVAPVGSHAEQWANENGYTFIPSDGRDKSIENPANVTDLGRSICTSVAGLRFGFTWDNLDEIEDLATDIEYGFIYSQKGVEDLSVDTVNGKTVKKAIANNRIDHGNTTSFNLVISNIPSAYYNREITARAYVCIDGMYFYSNVLKGSFGEVANLVLEDEEIDANTKNAVNNLLNKEI